MAFFELSRKELEERMARLEQQLISSQLRTETTSMMENELKRAQAEIEWLATFPLLSPRPIVEIDTDGRIYFVNPAAESLFPDLRQKGSGHPWLANWRSFLIDARDKFGESPSRQIQIGDRWYGQTFFIVPQTERVRIYGADITARRQAQEALRESEDRYRTLVEAAPDAIVVHRNNKFLYANSAAMLLLAADSFEHLASRNVIDFFRPEEREQAIERTRIAMAGNKLPMREAKLLRLDDQEIAVEFHTTSIDFQGERAIQTIIRDITERMRTESQQALVAGILRVLNRGDGDLPTLIREVLRMIRESTGFDAVGLRLRDGNDFPYYEQSGFSDEFLLQENFLCEKSMDGSIARAAEGRPVLECMFGLVLSGQTDPSLPFFTEGGSFWTNVSSELLAIPDDDDPRTNPRNRCIHNGYQSIALIPVRSGREIIGLLQLNARGEGRLSIEWVHFYEGLGDQIGLAIRRNQIQEELKSLNESLEQRIADRTAEVERRSEQLRKLASELTVAEQRERKRMAQVLHDGLQQILVGAKFRLASIERSNNPRQIASEASDIIDEAIDISRSLTAELSPPILHQSGLVAALEWLVRWMHDKQGLTVDLTAREKIYLPQEELAIFLYQAIKELLFNTIKHAGVRTARIHVIQREDQVQVVVEDDGIGFNQTQLQTVRGQAGGFGLFSLSERLSMLGGRMTIDSSPGCGCRILLFAPLSVKPGTIPPSTERQANVSVAISSDPEFKATCSEKKLRLVLVDDHAVMRQGLASLLRAEPDMEIAGEASDGESAVLLIREVQPDLVLMDVSMPGIGGIQATRVIHSEFPHVRVIGLSMFQEGEQAVAMREAGAVGYVTKSGPSGAVIAAIRACIRSSEIMPDLKRVISTQST
jgi:PAS domain S-box-containing protein